MEGEIILTLGVAALAGGVFFLRAYYQQRHLVQSHQRAIGMMGHHAERVESAHEQFRKLYTHLRFAREEESLRVAHEIHNEAGWLPTVVRMDMRF